MNTTYCNCGKYSGGQVIGNTYYCDNCKKERAPIEKADKWRKERKNLLATFEKYPALIYLEVNMEPSGRIQAKFLDERWRTIDETIALFEECIVQLKTLPNSPSKT